MDKIGDLVISACILLTSIGIYTIIFYDYGVHFIAIISMFTVFIIILSYNFAICDDEIKKIYINEELNNKQKETIKYVQSNQNDELHTKYCRMCGTKLKEDAIFCEICGNKL